MRELTATDHEWISAHLTEYARRGVGPATFAQYAALVYALARSDEWRLPDDPFASQWWMKPEPPQVVCPPPGRVAVLPALTPHQDWLLGRAAHAAVHGRWRLWDGQWREVAELEYPRPLHWFSPDEIVRVDIEESL